MTQEKSLAQFVSELREKIGLSQTGLAKKSALPLKTIEDIESGQELFLASTIRQKLANALKIKPAEDTGLGLLNVKSNYDVKVFDKDENDYDGPVYHGAQVYANILIKPYKYMGQKGITAYLGSMVLVENGEASGGGSYDSIMSKVI